VTGSSVDIYQNGNYYANEQLEPLGQLVLPEQPFEEMPVSEGVAIQGADEPEGLCSAMEKHGTSFLDLPSVCRDIAIKNGRVSFEDVHPSKYSVTKIAINPTDSPIPDFSPNDRRADSAMSYALSATTKPDKKKKGDDDTECRPGRPCLPDENVNVPISAIDMTEIPGADASQSGPPIPMRLLDDWGNTQHDEWSLRSPRLGGSSPQVERPVWCHPDVIQAMTETWNTVAVSQGKAPTEVGFTVEGSIGNYNINRAGFTNQYKKLSIKISNHTFALFHSHPNDSGAYPSQPDRDIADANSSHRKGIQKKYPEISQSFPIFTFTSRGLFVYDPLETDKKLKERKLRDGLDWQKPCP
jgi:hypothetical protein